MGDDTGKWVHRLIGGLLLVAALLRVVIISSGGQFFTPDESRYLDSRSAAGQIMQGNFREGLARTLQTGEHPGFKLAGLLPALLEIKLGENVVIPALFFGAFSELNLILIWWCARRLGLTLTAQAWVTLLATSSTSLFFYSRHLYPYDLSMSWCLMGLLVGLRPVAGPWRRVFVGALCAAGFLTYLAYWLLAGLVMGLVVLFQGGGLRRLAWSATLVAVGFLAVIGALGALDWWAGSQLWINAGKFSGIIYDPDFGNSFLIGWEYLGQAEGLRLVPMLAGVIWAGWVLGHERAHRRWQSPLALGLSGVLLLYAGMVVGADGLHRTVVTGRVMRVMVPFLCVLGGVVLTEAGSRAGNRRRWLQAVLAGAIIGSAVPSFRTVLRQEFPRDFRQHGLAMLKNQVAAPAGNYYRFVNVEHYLFEPETLSSKPVRTLLAADHPYQFRPYLYEAFSPAKRRHRREVDHRMQLVEMTMPENRRVSGEAYGKIVMRVRFSAGRGGMNEPLLSLGPKHEGSLFFVRYLDAGHAVLGFESMGNVVLTSEPVAYEPDRDYGLEFYCGSLMEPRKPEADSMEAATRQYYRNLVSVRWAGREVLNSLVVPREMRPEEVYVGYNFVSASSADSAFSGEINDVRRGGYPPLPAGWTGSADYGAFRLVVWLPAAAAAVPEPLLVVGVPGQATLGYVRVLPGGRVRLGVEFWGVGAVESEPVPAPSDVGTEIVFHFPALYPPVGDPAWGKVSRAEQEKRRSHLTIALNGRIVLDQEVKDTHALSAPVALGLNPAGGSWVTDKYSGGMVQGMRLPLVDQN